MRGEGAFCAFPFFFFRKFSGHCNLLAHLARHGLDELTFAVGERRCTKQGTCASRMSFHGLRNMLSAIAGSLSRLDNEFSPTALYTLNRVSRRGPICTARQPHVPAQDQNRLLTNTTPHRYNERVGKAGIVLYQRLDSSQYAPRLVTFPQVD